MVSNEMFYRNFIHHGYYQIPVNSIKKGFGRSKVCSALYDFRYGENCITEYGKINGIFTEEDSVRFFVEVWKNTE